MSRRSTFRRTAAFVFVLTMLAGAPGVMDGISGGVQMLTASAEETETVTYYDENGEQKSAECKVIQSLTESPLFTKGGWYYIKDTSWYNLRFSFSNQADLNIVVADGVSGYLKADVNGNIHIYGQNTDLTKAGSIGDLSSNVQCDDSTNWDDIAKGEPTYKSLLLCNVNFSENYYTIKNLTSYNSNVTVSESKDNSYFSRAKALWQSKKIIGQLNCYGGSVRASELISPQDIHCLSENMTLTYDGGYSSQLDLTNVIKVTFNGAVEEDALTFSIPADFNNTVKVGSLQVSGNSHFGDTVESASLTVVGDASFKKAIKVTDSLTISGDANFASEVNAKKMTVGGDANFASEVNAKKMTVGGNAVFTSSVIADEFTINGDATSQKTLVADNIVLNGGTLNAIGGSDGTVANQNNLPAIVINDGGSITGSENSKLIASGGYGSAGIYAKGAITLNGVDVEATGGDYSAGIGSGVDQNTGKISIVNSTVKATAGTDCENGIGAGAGGTDGGICIKNSTVNSYLASGTDYDELANKTSAEILNSTVNGVQIEGRADYAGETVLDGGAYVVNGEQEVSERIAVSGNVQLILADGAKMTAVKGIEVPTGSTLTVNAEQAETLGSLFVTAPEDGKAGIGGGGKIVLNSGDFEIHGGTDAPAIGGNANGSAGTVVLNCDVTAYGGANAPAIGGGVNSTGGSVLLMNGTFLASAGAGADSGIGGVDSIRLEEATVTSLDGSGNADTLADKAVTGTSPENIVFRYSIVNGTVVNDDLEGEDEPDPDITDDSLSAVQAAGIAENAPEGFDANDTVQNPYGKTVITANRLDELYVSHVNTPKSVGTWTEKHAILDSNYTTFENNWETSWNLYGQDNSTSQKTLWNDSVLEDSRTFSAAVGGNFDGNRQGKEAQYAVIYLNPDDNNVYLGVRDINTRSVDIQDTCLGTKEAFYGTVANEGIYQQYLRIVTADFDNNGVDEIAVYNSASGMILVYKLTNFTGTKYHDMSNWNIAYTINVGKCVNVSMNAADTNRDGFDDLIVSANETVSVYSGSRKKTLSGVKTIDVSGINNPAVATFDYKGNGQKVIAVAGYSGSGENKGCIRLYEYNSATETYKQILSADNLRMHTDTNPQTNINFAYLCKNDFGTNLFYLNSVIFKLTENGFDVVQDLREEVVTYTNVCDDSNQSWITHDIKETPTIAGTEYNVVLANYSGDGNQYLLISKYNNGNWTTYKLPINLNNEKPYYFDGGVNPSLYAEKYLVIDNGWLFGTSLSLLTDYPKTCKSPQYQADQRYFYVTVNTDNDTAYMEYTGKHYYEYSDPKVLAVLASPPYFKDLLNNESLSGNYAESGTSYGKTKGTGTSESTSSTITASSFIQLETDISVFGYSIASFGGQTTFEYGITEEASKSSSVEYSSSYSTTSGEDKVVLYSIPYVVYEYTMHVFDQDGNMKEVTSKAVTPKQPGISMMNFDEYQELAENYSSLPQLDENVLTHTLGDPDTYPHSTAGFSNPIVHKDDYAILGYSGAGGGAAADREIAVSTENENVYSTSNSFAYGVYAGLGGTVTVGFESGHENEVGKATVTTEGSSYGTSMQEMPIEAKDYGYYLAWNLFAYESSYKSNGETVTFPVVSYLVRDVQAPPVLPEDIEQDYDETTDTSITLTWSYDQNVSSFNIYRTYNFPSGDENLLVGTVYSTDAVIEDGIQHYSFTDEGLNPYTDYEYHIEAVRATRPERSMLSDAIKANTKSAVGYPEFTIQGLNDDGTLTVYPDGIASATVVIDNPDDARSNIMYQWQKRDENGDWEDISGAVSAKYSFTSSSFETSGEYRCRVNSIYFDKTAAQSFYLTAYTDSFEAVYTLRTAISTSGLAVSCDENGIPSATISLVSDQRTHNAAPTGTVTFRFKGTNGTASYVVPVTTNGRTATATLSDVNPSALANGVYEVTAVYNGNRIFGSYESEQAILLVGNSSYHAVLFNQTTGDETNTAVYGEGIGYYIEKYTVAADGKITKEIVNNNVPIPDSKTQAAGNYTYDAGDCGELTYTIQKRPIVIGLTNNTSAETGKVEGNLPQLKVLEGSLCNNDALSSLAEISYKDSSGNAVNAPDNTTLPGSFSVIVTPKNSDKYSIECKNGMFDVTSAQYTLKAQVSGKGTVSMTKPDTISVEELKNGKKYTAGTEVSFTAVPENGYKITRWTVKTKNGATNYNGSNTLTFNLSAADTEVIAWIAAYSYKLSVHDAEGGSYQCSTSFTNGITYPSSTEKTFTATPDANYHFVRWQKYTGSKYEEITTPEITVSMMNGNVELYPVFELDTHKLTLDSKLNAYYYYDHDGKVSTPDVKKNVVSGDAIPFGTEVTVALKDDETLADGDKILLNENEIALTDGTYTFTMNQDNAFRVDEPNKMYTVSVTPKDTAGKDVSAQFEAEPEYLNGTEVTLNAPKVEGYNFIGWYNGTEKLSSKNQYTFTIHADANLTAKYEVIGKVSLTVSCEGVFTVNGASKSSTYKMNYPLGSKVTVATTNSNFAYWTNSYGMILSRSASYTFTVNGEETITAVMNTPIADKATLVFESAYNQVMARDQIAEGGTMDIPSVPYYNGYTSLGWDMNGDGKFDANDTLESAITRGLNAQNMVATIKPVYELIDASYEIAVFNGTGSGTYNQNALVTLTADEAPAGKKFSHWENAAHIILNYNTSFQIVADSSMTLTAVFVDEDVIVETQGTATVISMKKDEVNHKLSFVSYCSVPENCTINKAGVIATNQESVGASGNPDTFTAETAVYVFGDESSKNDHRFTFTKSKVNTGDTWYVRAYLVYTDEAGNSHTVYGDIVSQTM